MNLATRLYASRARTGSPLNTHDLKTSSIKYHPFIKTRKRGENEIKTTKHATIKPKRK
jgi:hypothetical protein